MLETLKKSTMAPERLEPLVACKIKPQDRSEEERCGRKRDNGAMNVIINATITVLCDSPVKFCRI